jgi:hypothetical protein
MIQDISEFMTIQEPDGFAPTIVGVETGNNTTITSDANQVVSGMASVEREKGSDVELKKKNCEGKSPDDSISISSSSPVATVKTKKGKRRKERDADTINISKKLLEEPVPKKKKKGKAGNDSLSLQSSSSSSSVASSVNSEDPQTEDDSENEELSFETICHRTRLFRKVLDYKPTSRVAPERTYLVIVMHGTCLPLYMQMRYHNKKRDKDIENFTSIERIVLIPRSVSGFMSYCISNLHVHMHGSIEKGSEQEVWLKEAASHIDVVTLKEGENFDNESWGIKVVYQDAYLESFKETFLSLLPSISKLITDTSVSGAGKIPAVSCGCSTANPNLYKHNRTNTMGGIRPVRIESGIPTLPPQQRE